MYARTAAGKPLTFVVSGLLWENSLVMLDLQTQSQWSHLLGEAMQGPLTGQRLEMLPSTMTDWRTWRERYPKTTVAALSRIGCQYQNQLHRFGSAALMDNLVVGLAAGDVSKDWSFVRLRKQPVVNSDFNGEPVLVCFHADSGTAVIFSRTVESRELTFQLRGEQLVDQQTGTAWDMVTGRALGPPLQGKSLAKLPAIVSLAAPWTSFHVFNVSVPADEFEVLEQE